MTQLVAKTKAESSSDLLDDIYSIKAFKERYSQLFRSHHELDYLLRNRHLNGLALSGAVICSPSGRRLSIVASKFAAWFMKASANADNQRLSDSTDQGQLLCQQMKASG